MSVRPFCGSVAQHRVHAREARVRCHGRVTTRVLKSNWEVSSTFISTRANGKAFFFLWFLRFFKGYKPEVPSHNSFEFQLCGMLKSPHAIRKEKARSSRCCGLFFTQVKNVKVSFFSFKKGNGNSQGLIRLSNNLYHRRCTKTTQIMST